MGVSVVIGHDPHNLTNNIDVLVCDVSFISLKKVIKPNICFLNNKSHFLRN